MSTDIAIRLNRDVMLGNIAPATSEALQNLLNLPSAPAVRIELLSGGRLYAIEACRAGVPGDTLVIGLEGREEQVSLTFYAIPEDGEARRYASASIGSPNELLDFAMGAAVAVGVTWLTGGVLIDEAARWSDTCEEQSPEAFIADLRLVDLQCDIEEAARSFADRTAGRRWAKHR